ncbi:MAG: hypothetical protein ABIT08_06205 [Bacteroidia bacterium]
MKKITLASAFLFVIMAFACEKSKAQSQADPNQQPTNQTDPNAGTTTSPDGSQPADPNAATEPNKVTIDSTAAGTTPVESGSSTTGTTRSESATKIHIYSGKHDGNNTINPDPKN